MRILLDRLASMLAAVFTVAICAGPAWFTHVAIAGGLAPTWAYAFVVGLACIGGILGFAFFRKALRGIAPSRQRRRS
jgi:hypothetical protein